MNTFMEGAMAPTAIALTAVASFVVAWALTRAWAARDRITEMFSAPDPKTYRRILSLFRFGSELLGKIPKRGDSPIEMLTKLLAMADAAEKVYGGKTTLYADIFAKYDLREKTSAPFVKLFFGTAMSKGLRLRRHGVNEHLEIIEAIATDDERIFFQETRYSGAPEISADFFHTPKFDFGAALAWLWGSFPHGMFLSSKANRWGGNEVSFSAITPPRDEPVSAKGEARIAAAVAAHQAREGEPYGFIAYGPRGTGKSRYVSEQARLLGKRLLMIDASSLPSLGLQEVEFLLDALQPGFLLLDDFDRAPMAEAAARTLFLFKHLKESHRAVTIAVTVNDPSKLDDALLRSERIDEAEAFDVPDLEERTDILGKVMGPTVDIPALAAKTEGFNHADLKGLARRARRETLDAAFVAMMRLRDLADKAAGAKKTEAKPDAAPTSPS